MTHTLQSGIYLHFKGFFVLVLGLARHSETEEKLVAYIPLEPKQGPRITVRPLTMFLETVEVNGVKVPRFKYIGSEMPDDFKDYLNK